MAKTGARVLTVAGSDSGGGAGIQADLKTFAALGVYGTCAVAALTAQNTLGVAAVQTVGAEFVERQIEAVLSDIGADAVKTGMLWEAETIAAVARAVERFGIERLVVDPVLASQQGQALAMEPAVEAYAELLFPLALVVTPNADEAARFAGFEVADAESQRHAAREIARLGPRFVLVKGGHIACEDAAVDVLYDGERFEEFSAPRVAGVRTHGAGCTLSAAIAAYLALGHSPHRAVRFAKQFTTRAIEHALAVGKGLSPVDQVWWLAADSGDGG